MPLCGGIDVFNADNEMTGFDGSTQGYDTEGQLTSDLVDSYIWDVRRHLNAISGCDSASFVGVLSEAEGTPWPQNQQDHQRHHHSVPGSLP